MSTPRTDAAAGYAITGHYGPSKTVDLLVDPSGPFVHASFAGQLERELARMERLYHGADADRRLLRGELQKEREKVRLLREALTAIENMGDPTASKICRHYLAATEDTP